MSGRSIAPSVMPSQSPPSPPVHDRVPSHSNDAVVKLAEAICKCTYELKGEPMPVVWMLSQAQREEFLRAAVRCVRGVDPAVRAVAFHVATKPPLPPLASERSVDEQTLRDVAQMRFAIEKFEAHLEGLTQS